MTLVGEPSVGIVRLKRDGTTYTDWYHHQGISWHTPPDIWIKDQLFFEKLYCSVRNAPRSIMAIVRQK